MNIDRKIEFFNGFFINIQERYKKQLNQDFHLYQLLKKKYKVFLNKIKNEGQAIIDAIMLSLDNDTDGDSAIKRVEIKKI